MSWICPECGIENRDDSNTLCFCGYNKLEADNQLRAESYHSNNGFKITFASATLIAIILVASIFGLYLWQYNNVKGSPPLSVQKTLKNLNSEKTLLTEDFLYKSPDGFSLIIPAGYKYTEFTSGPNSLVALREDTNAIISMAITDYEGELEDLVNKTHTKLKSTNESYDFSPEQEIDVGAEKCLRIDYTIIKKGSQGKGSILFAKSNKKLYQLLTLYQSKYESLNHQEIENSINSLDII